METGSFFPDVPAVPAIEEAEQIIKYETPKRISYSKLVETTEMLEGKVKKVHIGTVYGEPAWADGYMLEVAEVPEGLKKLKLYWEVRGPEGEPKNFDGLIPDLPPGSPLVTPLATVIGRPGLPETVYLADMRAFLQGMQPIAMEGEIAVQKKYIDYFRVRYPRADIFMTHKSSPVEVRDKGKIVGVIMPLFIDSTVLQLCRDKVWSWVEEGKTKPWLPPTPEPPVEKRPPTMTVTQAEMTYSLRQLQQMARQAGLSPVGSKVHLIKTLMKQGALK